MTGLSRRVGARLGALREPLADKSIRRLWYARLVSEAGDWAARIALALLVFGRTGSPLAATAVTAVSLLPHLGIGQLLATFADRYPHRTVMIVSDVGRGLLYLLLALVDLPVPVALGVAFLAGMGDPPFSAAHSAALPQLAGERYLATQTLFTGTRQAMTLVGFAMGGLLSAAAGPSAALAVNAVSFLVGVVFIAGVRPTRSNDAGAPRALMRTAVRALTSDRLIVVSAAVVTGGATLGIALEGLMVAYAAHLGLGSAGAGLLATVPPVAAILATVLLPTTGQHVRLVRLVCRSVAVLSLIALLAFALDSPLPIVLAGFLAGGALDVMTVPAGAVIGQRLPRATRATAFSFLEGTMKVTHAGAVILAGGLAAATSVPQAAALLTLPGITVAGAGLILLRRYGATVTAAAHAPLADPAPAFAD